MKSLEALKIILKHNGVFYGKDILQDYEELKEATKSVEKELKALELIKNKEVNTKEIMVYNFSLERYNYQNFYKLTQEEYNFLREVLNND